MTETQTVAHWLHLALAIGLFVLVGGWRVLVNGHPIRHRWQWGVLLIASLLVLVELADF